MENLITHENIQNLLNPSQEALTKTKNQAEYIHKILAQFATFENESDRKVLKKMLQDAVENFTT
jgi:hypothetical protein